MIDTIRFQTQAFLRPWLGTSANLLEGWIKHRFTKEFTHWTSESIVLECAKPDLRLHCTGQSVMTVSANLPKLLYGHNGRLIACEKEFQLAMQWLHWILAQLMTPAPGNDGVIPGWTQSTVGCHFTRIDLVWQFPDSIGILPAFESVSHPRIRKYPTCFGGETVELNGSFLKLIAYDKNRQMRLGKLKLPTTHRLEFSLKGKALSDVYRTRDDSGYSRVDWPWLQFTMRKIANEIQCELPAGEMRGIDEFLAYMERKAPMLRILEEYIRCKHLRFASARKLRARIKRISLPPSRAVCIGDMFPECGWPEPRHILLPDIENEHEQWLRLQATALPSLHQRPNEAADSGWIRQ